MILTNITIYNMSRIFNRRIITKKNKVNEDIPMFINKHHYTGIVHASIKRENHLNKRLEKENRDKEMISFLNDLKNSKSPASIRKDQRFTDRMDMTIFGYKRRDVV